MKGKALKEVLSNVIYPDQFHYDLLVCVTPLYEESFGDLLEHSGRKYQVTKMLDQRIQYLCEHRQSDCCRSEWIEKLSYEKDMYSIIIKDKDLNIRIPFVFYAHNSKPHVVLLKAFLEKNKRQSKTSSYSSEIKLLRPVLDHMEEMFQNGIRTD